MNVSTILDSMSNNFIEDYLRSLGIKNVKSYLKPTKRNFESPWNYPNMIQACNMIKHYVTQNKKIGIVIDSDMDGACSSALIYNFLIYLGTNKSNINIYYHEGKQHGIKDKLNEILENNGKDSLLIIPDAGSNDINECLILIENSIEPLIIDHHIMAKQTNIPIIVNNQFESVKNHALSGTGVADKVVRAYCEQYNIKYPNYADLVAVSLVTDICDLSVLENRTYIYFGLKNIENQFLQYLFDKCCKKRGKTPEAISWDIGPLGNALARSKNQKSKTIFFDALINNINPETALKEIRKIKRMQNEEVKYIVDELEPNLNVSSKVIVGFTDSENANFIGLIANKFTGKYNKPTILLRDAGNNTWSGSLRSPTPLATKINQSGLAKAQGHEEACGVLINKNNLKSFEEWLNSLNLLEKPDIKVTAKIKPNDITLDLCQTIAEWTQLWGKGVEAPTFVIDTTVTQDNIFIYEKTTTTVKLLINDISFIKFRATQSDVESFKKYNKFAITLIVGELSINEWEGIKTPQAIIKDYEITPIIQKEERWEDNF